MTQKAVRATVSGVVQGVGFRQSCRIVARSLGLVGWVGNRLDGKVEVWAQGEDVKVDDLISWLWAGPTHSLVAGVESDVVAADPTLRDFFIHPDPDN